MSSQPSLYYNRSGSYDFQKYIHSTIPLMEIRKNKQKNCASREFVNEENEQRIKCILFYEASLHQFCLMQISSASHFFGNHFSGNQFSGDQFSGDHFSRGSFFWGPFFPGTIFRGPFFRAPFFRGSFFGDSFIMLYYYFKFNSSIFWCNLNFNFEYNLKNITYMLVSVISIFTLFSFSFHFHRPFFSSTFLSIGCFFLRPFFHRLFFLSAIFSIGYFFLDSYFQYSSI